MTRSSAAALALALACSAPGFAWGQARSAGPGLTSDSPETPKTKEQLEAQQHFQRAKDLYQAGSYREAISELESARALDPKAKDLVFNLGIVHEKLGNYDDAIAAFQKYQQMDGVTAAERQRADAAMKRIEGAKREAAAHAPKAQPKTAPPPPPREEKDPPHGRIDGATVAAGSVAVAGLVVGTVFGVIAVSTKPSSSFTTGRDGTYQDLQDKTTKAHNEAIVSDVGFGVGIVAAAVTAYLFFGRTKDPSKSGALSVAPSIGLSSTGLGGTF